MVYKAKLDLVLFYSVSYRASSTSKTHSQLQERFDYTTIEQTIVHDSHCDIPET